MSFSKIKKPFQTGLLLLAGALFVLVTPATAGYAQSAADNGQLIGRLNQLENQVQTLSRSVYRGETPPVSTSSFTSGSTTAAANAEIRFGQVEDRLRQITGQIEDLNYRIQQMEQRLNKMQTDYDMRLQHLEGGTAATPGAATGSSAGSSSTLYALPQGQTREGVLGTLPATDIKGPEALYESAFTDIRDSKYEDAEKKFKQFMSQYPSHALAGNAQYWLAETFYVRGDYNQSAKMFAQGYQDYPKSPKAPDSLLKLGLSLAKLNKKDDACLTFQQLKKDYPNETVAANRRAVQEMKQLGCK